MTLFYYGFIVVLILIFFIVLAAWYSVYYNYAHNKSVESIVNAVCDLGELTEKQRGYLTTYRDGTSAFAFSAKDGQLYLTEDKSQWQEFIYMSEWGLVDAENPRNVLAYFNDIVTLAPPTNSRYTQTTKILDHNVILDIGKQKFTLMVNNNKLDIIDYNEKMKQYFRFILI